MWEDLLIDGGANGRYYYLDSDFRLIRKIYRRFGVRSVCRVDVTGYSIRPNQEREPMNKPTGIEAVLFDFGGVLAEEGFVAGLHVIAEDNGLDPETVIAYAFEIIYDLGFVLGRVREDVFWKALRENFGIDGEDRNLTEEILSRFTLRPWMLTVASELKKRGLVLGLLSDQCHWLDELNDRLGFFNAFDYIFNSYHMQISKKDPRVFDLVSKTLQISPEKILFIDDHEAHTLRAKGKGLKTILYEEQSSFLEQIKWVLVRKGDALA